MINAKMIAKMKRGAYLVNTARAKLVDRDVIVKARGLCWRCLVSAARAERSSLAHHAA
jgi:hypothetical protein